MSINGYLKITKNIYLLLLLPLWLSAQQTQKVDFTKVDAHLEIDAAEKSVVGQLTYEFDILSKVDTVFIDAINMSFTSVTLNGKSIVPKSDAKRLKLYKRLRKGKNTASISYVARPKQALYFTGVGEKQQIWTQGQGKYTSHWLPSFDDVNEKLIFNFDISADTTRMVFANGVLRALNTQGSKKIWKYRMKKPMSSYLAMLAIGAFGVEEQVAESGIPLLMCYSIGDEGKVEATYRHSKQIFDFLEREIGVAYPWEIYKQVPIRDFLYSGMENTSATIFSQDYVVDDVGFNDKNYVNVDAHELAHQWFGDLVTAKSGKHHWLQEGFATYYALLAEREVFGDDYFYNHLYEMGEALRQAERHDTIPLLNEKASSLTFYEKGAWALHVLRENVGVEKFRVAVKNYLEKYGFGNVDTDGFLAEINKVSDYDTAAFRKRWLENPKFEIAEAVALLQRNSFIRQLFDAGELPTRFTDATQLEHERLKILQSDAYYPVKQEVLYQLQPESDFAKKEKTIRAALQTNNVKVRQAVAQIIGTVPESLYDEYATLLDDRSYLTQEIAMATLWKQFPDKRNALLEKTKSRIGFNDKNLRIQWLAMALMQKDYEPAQKTRYYDELVGYASPAYESSVRRNAIEQLVFIGPGDTNALKLLVNPLVHHKWQFSKFARDKIRELIKYPAPRGYFEKLLPDLPEDEQIQLKRLLDEK
jgi:aminopeptidase N